MLNANENENGKKLNRSNQQHYNFARSLFFVHLVAVALNYYNVNFLVTHFMEEMSYVFLFAFFFCRCGSFSFWWPLTFLIIHFSHFFKSYLFLNCTFLYLYSSFLSHFRFPTCKNIQSNHYLQRPLVLSQPKVDTLTPV